MAVEAWKGSKFLKHVEAEAKMVCFHITVTQAKLFTPVHKIYRPTKWILRNRYSLFNPFSHRTENCKSNGGGGGGGGVEGTSNTPRRGSRIKIG